MDEAGRLAWGGTQLDTIVHWPRGIAARGGIRSQFHHVIDVAPTVLEAAGLPQQQPLMGSPTADRGVSMAYSFDGATEDDRHGQVLRDVLQPRHLPQGLDRGHQPQRAVGAGTFAAVLGRRLGGSTTRVRTGARRTTCNAEMPEKLAELQQLWLEEATKYSVLPLDDRRIERFNAELNRRPPGEP